MLSRSPTTKATVYNTTAVKPRSSLSPDYSESPTIGCGYMSGYGDFVGSDTAPDSPLEYIPVPEKVNPEIVSRVPTPLIDPSQFDTPLNVVTSTSSASSLEKQNLAETAEEGAEPSSRLPSITPLPERVQERSPQTFSWKTLELKIQKLPSLHQERYSQQITMVDTISHYTEPTRVDQQLNHHFRDGCRCSNHPPFRACACHSHPVPYPQTIVEYHYIPVPTPCASVMPQHHHPPCCCSVQNSCCNMLTLPNSHPMCSTVSGLTSATKRPLDMEPDHCDCPYPKKHCT